jgi:hypothetical protein
VGERGRFHVHRVAARQEVERPPGAHGLAEVQAASVQALASPGDDAARDERHAGIDEQRVQCQVAMAAQRFQHRLWDAADAHLHGGAVGDERGDVATDRALHLTHDRRRILDQRLVHLDPGVHLAGVQPAVATRARHGVVHLRDDERRRAGGRQRHAHRDAEAQVAVTVGRRCVHEHAVRRPATTGRELGDEVEVAERDEFDAAAAARVLQPRRHVPRRVAERGAVGLGPRVVAEVDAAHERQVAQALGLAADLGHEGPRLAAARWQQHLHARPQQPHGLAEPQFREPPRHRVRYIHPFPPSEPRRYIMAR